jgi:hypothetical protein
LVGASVLLIKKTCHSVVKKVFYQFFFVENFFYCGNFFK